VPIGLTAPAQEFADLAYAGLSPAQSLDLYLPRRTGRAVPLVIDIHGGAFMGGTKSDSRGRIDSLLARGYAVASVNYRLSEEAPFPAGVKDAKAAVRWLRAASPRYGLDPTRFAAWGDSAGGYFAVMLGSTSGVTTTFDDPALGNAGISSAVQAVVDFYGPVNFLTMDRQAVSPGGCAESPQVHDEAGSPESLWLGAPVQTVTSTARSANPITYFTGKGTPPPFFIAHGAADCDVPHGQSLELSAALRTRHIANSTYLLPGIGHGAPELDQQMSPLAIAFLGRTFARA
jgi:acetyl esterase/lipase